MKVWDKPIISVLGINKTSGSEFRALSGVILYDNSSMITERSGKPEERSGESYSGYSESEESDSASKTS